MLIKRVYEMDPMVCPKCGGQMKVVAFIEPPQREVIEKILRHCEPAPMGPVAVLGTDRGAARRAVGCGGGQGLDFDQHRPRPFEQG